VDLTRYVEKHEFVFDAVLNEEVTNDEVTIVYINVKCSVERNDRQHVLYPYVTLFKFFLGVS